MQNWHYLTFAFVVLHQNCNIFTPCLELISSNFNRYKPVFVTCKQQSDRNVNQIATLVSAHFFLRDQSFNKGRWSGGHCHLCPNFGPTKKRRINSIFKCKLVKCMGPNVSNPTSNNPRLGIQFVAPIAISIMLSPIVNLRLFGSREMSLYYKALQIF